MKAIYLTVFSLFFLLSCTKNYGEAGINNNTDHEIQFITIGTSARTINSNAVLTDRIENTFYYTLASRSYESIIRLDGEIEAWRIYMDTLIIINQLDTLSLNGNEEIFDAMEKFGEIYQIEIE